MTALRQRLIEDIQLADVIGRHGHRLEDLSGEQQRILRAIVSCRTAALGGHVEAR